MVHVRRNIHATNNLRRSIKYIGDVISRSNQKHRGVSFVDLLDGKEADGYDGWKLYCLVFDIFRKDSVTFPNLEVLAYGDPVGLYSGGFLLIARDPWVPSGCTIVSPSELEAHTTVKSPMSFLRAFTKRPKTFWDP